MFDKCARRKHSELKQSPFYTASLLKASKWKMVPSKLQRCTFLQAVFGVNKSKFDILASVLLLL